MGEDGEVPYVSSPGVDGATSAVLYINGDEPPVTAEVTEKSDTKKVVGT